MLPKIDGRSHRSAALLLWACALVWPAAAHSSPGVAVGFVTGFEHPLTGFDHLLAMVSVGLWGAVLGRPLIVALPVVFPAMMAIGGLMGIAKLPIPPVEIGIALSVLLLGAVIALSWRAPAWLAVVLVAAFAIFHGYAHGRELPAAADPVSYSAGFVLATGLLHVVGIALGAIRTQPYGDIAIRGVGALISAAGCYFLVAAVA